jgi:hypothetical protein
METITQAIHVRLLNCTQSPFLRRLAVFYRNQHPSAGCFIGEVHQPYLEKPGYFGYTVFLKEVPPDVTTKLEQLCAGFAVGSES